ncbi:MAG: hypothetical protein NC937_02685 [Candidatus Omnitrophica bacterium]|nr:hypothetical protein [Candidatus Omnitrophota bacterium]
MVIRPAQPIDMPKEAKKIGIWIYGNGALQIDFELLDAKGQKMTGVPNAPTYQPGTPYDARHAFDGWQYFTFDLPQTGARSNWKGSRGKAPFKLSGLILQQYGKVVSLDQLKDPVSRDWKIGDIIIE